MSAPRPRLPVYLAWSEHRQNRKWALPNPRRLLSFSGRTLFPPEMPRERNLRAIYSVLNRPYRKTRRCKTLLLQTSNSGSTKQGYNFRMELMWSRFGAFWEFDLYWASRKHLRHYSSGQTKQVCLFSLIAQCCEMIFLHFLHPCFHFTFTVNESDNSVEWLHFGKHRAFYVLI